MADAPDYLYHASPVQGLTKIAPQIGTHGQNWVYTTDDPVMAAIFLGRLGGDFTCTSGVYQGKPYLCERFSGAIERRYGSVQGSIYTLPGANFLAGQTSFSKDSVCPGVVEPIQEIRVDKAKRHLLQLASEGTLTIKLYPERFCIPDNDRDLIEKALRMYQRSGNQALEQVCDFHPQLLGRIMEAIAETKI